MQLKEEEEERREGEARALFSMEISYRPSHLPRHLPGREAHGVSGRIRALHGKKTAPSSCSCVRNCHKLKDFSAGYDFKPSCYFEKIRSLKYDWKNTRLFAIREPLESQQNDKNKALVGDDEGWLKRNDKTIAVAEGVEQVLHMVGGTGEISYAKNSRIQSKGIVKAKSVVEEAVEDIYKTLAPEKFVAVDLACSSGPNTFLVISEIINTIDMLHRKFGRRPPEVLMFLNDLPGNDFNNIFRSLREYERQVREEDENFLPFYVAGSPGSFYTRLFPAKSVHFFHSSYGQMWLSKVPEGVDGKSCPYLGNEHSYMDQFRGDFSTFLNLRAKELISGGRMVLTISGRRDDPKHKDMSFIWGLLSVALNDMISEGILEECDRKGTNFPFHTPSMEEIESVVQAEGSFYLEKLQTFELSWDPFEDISADTGSDYFLRGQTVANYIRAAADPMLDCHFDRETIDDLFSRYAKFIAMHLKEKPKWVSIILDLKLRE